jgi:hypothetical protein
MSDGKAGAGRDVPGFPRGATNVTELAAFRPRLANLAG